MTTNDSQPNQSPVEEGLDPRIQHQLDLMNTSAVLINKFENDLGLAQERFRQMYQDSLKKLDAEASKVGRSVYKALGYYDCRVKANEAQEMAHEAVVKYEKAVSMESTAREMVEITEKGCEAKKMGQGLQNLAWPEMLNHATNKLLDSEAETVRCEEAMIKANKSLTEALAEVRKHYKRNKRSISKSKVYYEMKAKFHQMLEAQKVVVAKIEEDCSTAKYYYARSMANLETISNEIHNKRKGSSASITAGSASSPCHGDVNHNTADSLYNDGVDSSSASGTPLKGVVSSRSVTPTDIDVSGEDDTNNLSSSLSTSSTSLNNSDDESVSSESLMLKRSVSYTDLSRTSCDVEPASKPRSMSAPTSPDLSSNNSSPLLDGSMASSCSSILDDKSVSGAASKLYFDSDSGVQSLSSLPVPGSQTTSKDEDYYTLPSSLSGYQKQYTLRRNSIRITDKTVNSEQVSGIFSAFNADEPETIL